jgi:hypothetical protein
MDIGIMMQSLNEAMGGIGIYTQEIVRALLEVDAENRYLLLYPGFGDARKRKGEFSKFKNVTEVETDSPSLGRWVLRRPPRVLRKCARCCPSKRTGIRSWCHASPSATALTCCSVPI